MQHLIIGWCLIGWWHWFPGNIGGLFLIWHFAELWKTMCDFHLGTDEIALRCVWQMSDKWWLDQISQNLINSVHLSCVKGFWKWQDTTKKVARFTNFDSLLWQFYKQFTDHPTWSEMWSGNFILITFLQVPQWVAPMSSTTGPML